MTEPLEVERRPNLLLLRLSGGKGNIVDAAMVRALQAAVEMAATDPHLKAIILSARGPHFSFGASVEEHLPDRAPEMLCNLHDLFRDLLTLGIPMVSAVRGQCLGGALELVLCGSFVVASPDAKFGQPEIRLGVFAPMASVMLPIKVGMARAEGLLLTGAAWDAATAAAAGLVDEIAPDPEAAALALCEKRLLPSSASSLRLALRAAREVSLPRIAAALSTLERLYLGELMASHDGREGIAAFLEKRAPQWSDA
ncbi:MAG: enoyl-CoA hydratase-related protein [Acidobacteriota bacterium]